MTSHQNKTITTTTPARVQLQFKDDSQLRDQQNSSADQDSSVNVPELNLKLDLSEILESKLVMSTEDINDVHTPRDFDADDVTLDSNDVSIATTSSNDVTVSGRDDVSVRSSADVSEMSLDGVMTSQVVMRSPKADARRRGE